MLKDIIDAVELQMKGKLEEIRAKFEHPGDKGSTVEDTFRSFLRQYLPRRLEVGQGEIVDSKGRKSKQTDIIIVSEDHPFTFTPDQPGFFFIEGVCAAGEVKTTLTSAGLKSAIDNSFYFKQLEAVFGKNTMFSSSEPDIKRFYKCPPYFLIAFESQLKLEGIYKEIENYASAKGFDINEINKILDAVFILDQGWLINFGDGKGSFYFKKPNGEKVVGLAIKYSDSVLFALLGWLSAVMPRMIRFEPILPRYIVPGK